MKAPVTGPVLFVVTASGGAKGATTSSVSAQRNLGHFRCVPTVIVPAFTLSYSLTKGRMDMEDRNTLTIASALGEAAMEVALRGAAMFLATLTLLMMLMGMALVSSVAEATVPTAWSDDVLLMPATEPANQM